MIVGILSDTHGREDAARAAVGLLRDRGAEFLIHCGDIGSDGVLDQLAGEPPALVVWGNNDNVRELVRYAREIGVDVRAGLAEIELAGKSFAVTHGDDPALVRRVLAEQRHDYLLLGHSHVKCDYRRGRVRVINPGALYRAAEKTVAILDMGTDALEFLPVSW